MRFSNIRCGRRRFRAAVGAVVLLMSPAGATRDSVRGEDSVELPSESTAPRDPLSISLIPMDLDAATQTLRRNDLDDNGQIGKPEVVRLGLPAEVVRRFDLNDDGALTHVELALRAADSRLDHGIVQMDSILAERYTRQYDRDGDGRLSLEELDRNRFTDQQAAFDRDSDGLLSPTELIRGLAFERRLRDELGIKGCDQGGAMKFIGRADRDGDRRVDAEELASVGAPESTLEFDRDGNKKLSVSELAECLAARRHELGLTPSDQLTVRSLLRQLDRNRNAVIEADEIQAGGPDEILAEADADSDGDVTEIELERWFGRRRKELGFDDEDAQRARILIGRNDTDHDRALSRGEMEASGADRNSPISPTKFSTTDRDHDGRVSLTELAQALHRSGGE